MEFPNMIVLYSVLLSKCLIAQTVIQPVCLLDELDFVDLCRKISNLPSYRGRYTVKPEAEGESRDCPSYDIYLPFDSRNAASKTNVVTARVCPSNPTLLLSDGPLKCSAVVYRPLGSGVERISEVSKLISLGCTEGEGISPDISRAESIRSMNEIKFMQTCEEILKLPEFEEYSMVRHGKVTDSQEYKVFQFDQEGRPIVDYVKARSCPTKPQLFLSDGPENYSAFLYLPIEKGLLRGNTAVKLKNLGYEKHEGVQHKQKDVHQTMRHLQSIYLMKTDKFALLCVEILCLPEFQSYYLDLQFGNYETVEDNVYLASVERREARRCPTESELFLSDGPDELSMFVYKSMDGGLVQIDQLNGLTSLLPEDSELTLANLSLDSESTDVLSMLESDFQNLCNEIIHRHEFSPLYKIKTSASSTIYEERDVYLLGDQSCIGRVSARSCPTVPELLVSSGTDEYSVYVYHEIPSGLLRINKVQNLFALGFRESGSSLMVERRCCLFGGVIRTTLSEPEKCTVAQFEINAEFKYHPENTQLAHEKLILKMNYHTSSSFWLH